jgi:transposase
LGRQAIIEGIRLRPEYGSAISARGRRSAFQKKPVRRTAFHGLDDWLRERFFRHDGNADVIRKELAAEHGIIIGLRSVELKVRHWRRELKAQKRATVRFETAPGHQMQIDFGDTKVWIGGERVRIHVFVATLAYSRRLHTRMEGAFLIDNAKALVEHHDAATREVRSNERLHTFARYWGFTPRACAPSRARTKARTSAVSATSRRTRSLVATSRAGPHSRRISIGGRERLPINANMAPPASNRQTVLSMRPRRYAHWQVGHASIRLP